MAAATAQGSYINPMAAIATQLPHAAVNGIANSGIPSTPGRYNYLQIIFSMSGWQIFKSILKAN